MFHIASFFALSSAADASFSTTAGTGAVAGSDTGATGCAVEGDGAVGTKFPLGISCASRGMEAASCETVEDGGGTYTGWFIW